MSNFNISYIYSLKDKFSVKLRRLNRLSKKHSLILRGMKKDIKQVKSAYKRFGLVGIAAYTGMAIAAAKFQSGLTNTLNLLSKDTIKKFGSDLELAQENAVRMGFGLGDTNKSLFDTVSAIGDVNKSLDIFNIAQKLAIGGAANLSTTVDGLTSVINAYGKAQTDATEVANAFFSAQRAGKTEVAFLAQNIGKVAPIAKQAGIGFKTLLATMAQLTLGGLSTEESSTALRGAIAGLLKPTDEARKIFEAVGIPVGASALQAADFTEVLKKLAFVAKKAPDALAEMIPNVRALTAISALGEEQVENLRKIIANINKDFKEGTGLNDAYNRKLKDITQRFKMTTGTLLVMSKRFGKELLPVLTKFFKVLTKVMSLFIDLNPVIKKIILILGGLALAFTGVVLAIGSFVALKGILIPTLAILTKMFIIFWGAVGGPITAIVAGVLLLAGLGVYLYQKWQPFRNTLDYIANLLKSIGSFAGAPLSLGNKLLEKIGLGNGSFDAKIDINAPPGTVKSVKTKEKKGTGFNLGFNLKDRYLES